MGRSAPPPAGAGVAVPAKDRRGRWKQTNKANQNLALTVQLSDHSRPLVASPKGFVEAGPFGSCPNLVEERETHVVVGLLLLGLLLLLLGGGTTGGGTSGSGGRGGSTTTNVGDEVVDALPLQELGEESWPVWLNLDSGGLHDGGDLVGLALRRRREASSSSVPRDLVVVVVVVVGARVWGPRPTLRLAQEDPPVVVSYRDGDAVIVQDESGVGASKFSVGHLESWWFKLKKTKGLLIER